MISRIMCTKIISLAFLVSGGLFGMDNAPKQCVWDKTATHYAYIGDSHLYEGAHISMRAHPVIVKCAKDHKIIRWFNFDNEVKLVQFENDMLLVTLNNTKTYQFYYTRSS